MDNSRIFMYFNGVKTTKEYNGYIFSVGKALSIMILGSLCGLSSISQIHQWAQSARIKEFLRENFTIDKIPCYFWLLSLLKIINPKSLNQHFTTWVNTLLPKSIKNMTLTFDGKSIRSTGKMNEYDNPIHVLSAHLAELGLIVSQKTVDVKRNEIPAMRELIELIDISGCMVVADALHCQTKTAQAIVEGGADYLLSVKGNQKTLKADLEDYVQDVDLRADMDSKTISEKNGGRIENRTAFTTTDIEWLKNEEKWAGLACIGAINTKFTTLDGSASNEWHYYISSRPLDAEDLLKYG